MEERCGVMEDTPKKVIMRYWFEVNIRKRIFKQGEAEENKNRNVGTMCNQAGISSTIEVV